MVLDLVLRRLIKTGKLTVTDWKSRVTHYGDGTGKSVHIKFNTAAAARKMALDPDLQMGECYMSGEFEVIGGNLMDFLSLALLNAGLDGKSLADLNRSNIVHDTLY